MVEHARESNFERVASQDSFAMDDATSEEVHVIDPRFARAMNGVEPATELLDKEWLAAIAKEDAERLDTDMSQPLPKMPLHRPVPALDPATERVDREAVAAALLNELTLPTPIPRRELEPVGEPDPTEDADLTVPSAALPSDRTGFVQIRPPTPAPAPARELPPSEPRPQTTPNLPSSLAPTLDHIDMQPVVRAVEAAEAAEAEPLPAVREAEPAPLAQTPAPSSERSVAVEAVPLPLVGLVVAGSGGIVAIAVAVVVAVVVMMLVIFLSGGGEADPPPTLPPIEIPEGPAPAPEIPTEISPEPAPSLEPEPSQPKRRTTTPEPAPLPEPATVTPEPEPELPPDDIDLQPEPEPEKRGLFGKKKKG